MLTSGHTKANENDNWRFSGFVTLGASYSSNDELAFRSSYLNKPRKHFNVFTDTLVGFQFNYHFSDELDLVVQAIAQDRGDNDLTNYFEMAFLRYQIDRNWSARAGRMNYNAYLLSEFRNVSYAYPWVRPPVDFYLPTSSVSYVDGAEIQYRHNGEDGVWQHTLAVGQSESNLFTLNSFSTIYYDYVVNATTTYETYDWLLKITGSYFLGHETETEGTIDTDALIDGLQSIPEAFWPGIGGIYDHLHMDDEAMYYLSVGYQYNNDEWLLMTELVGMNSDWTLLTPYVAGYISVGYRFDDLLPYVTIAGVEMLKSPKQLATPAYDQIPDPAIAANLGQLAYITQSISDAITQNQRSLGVGIRWDFSAESAIKVQYDHFWVDVPGYALWGSGLDTVLTSDQNSNVISFTYSTTF